MLGLDYLTDGTLSRRKVATDPRYIFNRPRVVHFGWPPGEFARRSQLQPVIAIDAMDTLVIDGELFSALAGS